MVIDNTPIDNEIWKYVYDELGFSPSCQYRGHSLNVKLPFQINEDYSVYGIENMTDDQLDLLDDTIRKIFIKITNEGDKIYALDWQHSSFLYDPRNISEQEFCCKVLDARYTDGQYTAYFPAFCPDGDYYFFIEEKHRFGYLGHPWREEIWIFGCDLMKEIEQIYQKFGWIKIK